jgi:hypothetical protein
LQGQFFHATQVRANDMRGENLDTHGLRNRDSAIIMRVRLVEILNASKKLTPLKTLPDLIMGRAPERGMRQFLVWCRALRISKVTTVTSGDGKVGGRRSVPTSYVGTAMQGQTGNS